MLLGIICRSSIPNGENAGTSNTLAVFEPGWNKIVYKFLFDKSIWEYEYTAAAAAAAARRAELYGKYIYIFFSPILPAHYIPTGCTFCVKLRFFFFSTAFITVYNL